jgi:hypothetical protein
MTGRELTVSAGLTPPDCDLRDFGHMPLDVRKFRDSDLVALEDPEAIVAAIMLWGAAWHQIPAASLPDDDRVLANLAGYGIRPAGVAAWRKVKAGALRGFVKCSDGRLYHPLVAEKALAAWEGKLKQRWRTFCATIRKHNERNPDNKLETPEYENWLGLGRPEKVAQLPSQNASAGPLFDSQEGSNVTRDIGDASRATNGVGHGDVTGDMASKRKGERKGEGDSIGESTDNVSESGEDLLALTARITAAAGVSVIQPNRLAREMDIVKHWTAAAIPVDLVLDVIATRLRAMRSDETVSSLAYFDAAILKRHATTARTSAASSAPPPMLNVPESDDPRVEQFRQRLRDAVGPRAYDGWLGPKVAAFSLNGRSLKVTTASDFMANWVEQHFGRILATTAGVEDVKVVAQ